MMPMMPVMAVAVMATEDHTAKRQDAKQTHHFVIPPFHRSVCAPHRAHVHDKGNPYRNTGSGKQNTDGYFSNLQINIICFLHF